MKILLRGIGILVFFFLSCAAAFAEIVKGPYLIFEGSNTEMTVLWQVDKFETNILSWGTDKNYATGKASVPEYGVKYGEENGHQHKYKITCLTPGTKYYYQVEGYGYGSFVTAPKADATAVKLLAYGDTRSNPENQQKVAKKMRQAYNDKNDPAFQTIVLHSRDWVSSTWPFYNCKESSWTSDWFVSNPNYQDIRELQAEVPIVGVRGNHEKDAKCYKKYYPFPYPYSVDFYWSFDYGPAHVVILDNYVNYDQDSAQYKWLVNELSTTRKPWKIVMIHEPAWGAGPHNDNEDSQKYLQPLFRQYGVELVLTGHNHNYAHAIVDGVHHVTTGGGGVRLHDNVKKEIDPIKKTDISHHYCEIDINGNTLTLRARKDNDSVIETFNITHDAANAPTPAAP